MKEKEMKKIAAWIAEVVNEVKNEKLPEEKEKRSDFVKAFRARADKNKRLLAIASEVKSLTKNFPLP
jgi:glycine/serine hydroxymethyltransferase